MAPRTAGGRGGHEPSPRSPALLPLCRSLVPWEDAGQQGSGLGRNVPWSCLRTHQHPSGIPGGEASAEPEAYLCWETVKHRKHGAPQLPSILPPLVCRGGKDTDPVCIAASLGKGLCWDPAPHTRLQHPRESPGQEPSLQLPLPLPRSVPWWHGQKKGTCQRETAQSGAVCRTLVINKVVVFSFLRQGE